ncbi:hypothetical protein DFJ58DRAFT_818776 [Suillus subalutaceus]|uniref:uncharacterized protein n=1 Tax=Suillus subalutaceus TaxID=48586 RepID=UPI001B87FE73|nr:uncharacterized protein DFJ58DRAFT_818776 [Suillus subalutaceus]KAG1836318.1 hypothetical protein DFJ58DRAFT_818776 [Suillus subalutaceus]
MHVKITCALMFMVTRLLAMSGMGIASLRESEVSLQSRHHGGRSPIHSLCRTQANSRCLPTFTEHCARVKRKGIMIHWLCASQAVHMEDASLIIMISHG